MRTRHRRVYYIGGLISLLGLPFLLLVSTSDVRSKAIPLGAIEIVQPPDWHVARRDFSLQEQPSYTFIGQTEAQMLSDFQSYLGLKGKYLKDPQRVNFPDSCSLNFFVQAVDILRINGCRFRLEHHGLLFWYSPASINAPQYEPATLLDEVQYLWQRISSSLSGAWNRYVSHEAPSIKIKILKYSDLGPPFKSSPTIKLDPWMATFCRVIGFWFVPIVLVWTALFFLSIRRLKKLLPNKRLELTEVPTANPDR